MALANINGIRINYKDEGRGEPLVLIAGFNSELITWFWQTRVWKKHFRIISFENRGSGKSDRLPGPYSMQTMAGDTLGLMDHLGIASAHILGVSMGGMIAQEIAIRQPERVRKLVIGTAYACIDEHSGPTPQMFQAAHLPIRPMLDAMAGLMVNRSLFRLVMLPMAKVKNRLADTNSILAKRDAAFIHDTRDRLCRIKTPTLVITGTADHLIRPDSSRVLAELIPGARLVEIEGGSHLLFIEMAKRFNEEVLKFLREN